ncbi:hypothetical protein GCM10027277_08620 [Pseudoduganella ginsengisoli]|uniref:Uncharacterized protein n=1 Tax=Pseudoduganella ginsengisoli TaxID=1462440 RepID=A0A6L6Q1R6_9BURK|nr:hypothetical protein [Pseudoduganella ginsengisoli]MTW03198.1 hypothetical protein [Pseudoduganella ginsengisoli]
METEFEILPFSAEWQEAELLSGESEQGERGMRIGRGAMGGGRLGRPARGAVSGAGKAGRAGMGGGTRSGWAASAGKAGGLRGKGGAGKGVPLRSGAPDQWHGARPWPQAWHGPWHGRWPYGWIAPAGGFWPAGVAVYEPDWLAAGDAPLDAADDADNSDFGGDGAGEWEWR